MARSTDLWDVLQNLQLLTQTEDTTPLVAVDDFLPTTEPTMPLADAVSIPNDGHGASYLFNNAASLFGLAQFG